MKWNFSVPLALVLAFGPGTAIAMSQSGAGASQQQQPAIETSHAVLPISIEQAGQVQAKTPEQSQPSPRVQFQNCNRLIVQARDQAHTIANSTNQYTFNPDRVVSQHKELKASLGDLKQEQESLYQGLSKEQQYSVQMRNANLLQANDRLQSLVKEMERELTDSTLHSRDVAEQARTTQRELKSYQKEFRAMGKDLGFAND